MMNFVATAAAAGLAAVVVVANLQGTPIPSESSRTGATMIDPMATSSVPAVVPASGQVNTALRMIDLRSGASCRIPAPTNATAEFTSAPVGPDCKGSPALARVTQWRQATDGTLEMADDQDRMVLRFMPGDGVLYESFYPSEALVTIVSANG